MLLRSRLFPVRRLIIVLLAVTACQATPSGSSRSNLPVTGVETQPQITRHGFTPASLDTMSPPPAPSALCTNRPVTETVRFSDWLEQFGQQAVETGLSPTTTQQALRGVRFNPRVVDLDSRQPEFTRPIWEYLASAVSASRIQRGRQLLTEYRSLLNRIEQRYGVQPAYLLAIWAIESDFGRSYGNFRVLDSLASLAYQGRRAQFGCEQLLAALQILDREPLSPDQLIGSWAGAMGHMQFIPTAFLSYAVDFDGDGRRDLWDSVPDVLASAANYLAAHGWHAGVTWGLEVTVQAPGAFDWGLSDPTVRKPLGEWQSLGIRRVGGQSLPSEPLPAGLLLPAGYRGPAFLTLENFEVIKRYNTSTSYALAVGHLADRINGGSAIVGRWPTELAALSLSDRVELQLLLRQRGYDPGAVDGLIGPRTQRAIRAFQRATQQPADGYPSMEVLNQLRRL